MKGTCMIGAMKKDRKKTLTNEKATKRAIKAAVDKAKEVDQEMEKYRDADRLEEAINVSNDPNNHEYE